MNPYLYEPSTFVPEPAQITALSNDVTAYLQQHYRIRVIVARYRLEHLLCEIMASPLIRGCLETALLCAFESAVRSVLDDWRVNVDDSLNESVYHQRYSDLVVTSGLKRLPSSATAQIGFTVVG